MSDSQSDWNPSSGRIRWYRAEVLSWFAENGRDLPWRRTRDAYEIVVSELMLQQTQVSRVLKYYSPFLDRFPTITALASASKGDVLRSWQGLGYNRRALFLKQTCEDVLQMYGGMFPSDISILRRLPGLGAYTADAVACFAFDAQVPVLETNTRAAIRHFIQGCGGPPDADLRPVATALMPVGDAWRWNQALMDYGAINLPRRKSFAGSTASFAREPFEETDRYWRGRIMALLCAQDGRVAVGHLLRELPPARDEYRVRSLLESLNGEGLLSLNHNSDEVGL